MNSSDTINCPCGSRFKKCSLTMHKKTDNHKTDMNTRIGKNLHTLLVIQVLQNNF